MFRVLSTAYEVISGLQGRAADAVSASRLQSLGVPIYLPATGGSQPLHQIDYILSSLSGRSLSHVVEMGSGASTVYFSQFLRTNKPSCLYTSVEHDSEWVNRVSEWLTAAGLPTDGLIHAPLSESSSWYSSNRLQERLAVRPVDVLLVDGPPAQLQQARTVRRHALAATRPFWSAGRVDVFLDDCHRAGEQMIVKEWTAELRQHPKLLPPLRRLGHWILNP